jgi:uncharacterized membrane protein
MRRDMSGTASTIGKSRLEFLFDGVFAIAMTILVLELKVPELEDRRSVHDLAGALVQQAPTFVSYLISFVVLGVFWYRHNHQYEVFRVITPGLLVLHFVQLAAAAFFPFCAALFGRYPTNPFALTVYLGCIAAYAWAAYANMVVAKRSGVLAVDLAPTAYNRARGRWLRACVAVTSLFTINVIRALSS